MPIGAEEAAYYGALKSVHFTFLKNGIDATAGCSVLTASDGSYLLQLEMNSYLIRFVSERFTEVRVDRSASVGYKIPRSTLVTETLYMIPRTYEITDETGGFLEEQYSGSVATAKRITPRVYYRDENYCYISRDDLPEGTVLAMLNSSERYTVRLTSMMTGVYQINAGYTVFCPIDILEEDQSYYLVSSTLKGSITTYDTLLLNAANYSLGQVMN